MRRSFTLTALVCLFALAMHAQGNEVIIQSVQARSLNGVVKLSDTALANVKVEECDKAYAHCVLRTHTTEDGSFVVDNKIGKVHYLRFLSLGIDEQRVTVTIDPKAPTLHINMHVGT